MRVPAGDCLAEDDVLSVQPGRFGGGDEELAAVGVGARVGHREQSARVGRSMRRREQTSERRPGR